jgi:hypothetical protein
MRLTRRWIVIYEPSIFRVAETKVFGPFTRLGAWWFAKRLCWMNPYCATWRTLSDQTVKLGDITLWPRSGARS